jgi:hypothetical protein
MLGCFPLLPLLPPFFAVVHEPFPLLPKAVFIRARFTTKFVLRLGGNKSLKSNALLPTNGRISPSWMFAPNSKEEREKTCS